MFGRLELLLYVLLAGSLVQATGVPALGENPVVDGYFGDPTVLIHEGTLYLMATKDPWGGDDLACFSTTDLKSWRSHTLNWPTYDACISESKNGNRVWAPEVIRGPDGRFYLYVSVGSEIYCGVAAHPLGPWENVRKDRGPIVHSQRGSAVHTIDASPFIDTDGRVYLYWGSGHNWENGQCMAVELEPDMHTFRGAAKNITPPNYFEGPHMVKRNGKYYLMYSEGKTIDKSYQVRYAVGDSPLGSFTKEGRNSPILSTDEQLSVWGPGHHCVFSIHGQDFIAYHRHRRPYDPDPMRRQICFDFLSFDRDGWIERVRPTESGIAPLAGPLE
ncbi:Arabinoxylan arabinofuranohydrolase precursor [Posidoniimonas corsicana]|uniref:Arabinoxylan arabinofuranohydrolase n=1 Tax=Posidoniimonas corsicana TaxID=1938618 RepID=A0A5C5V7T8_9BACT|nr:family 43 glycosylhydrolase [Posidoniimonas corsicana]TWT34033.1 Arabinoxylan arabinofuranohydrolase precursor [Posidoniimonas corsicana]